VGLNILFKKIKGHYQYLGQIVYLFCLIFVPLITARQRLWRHHAHVRSLE